MPGGYSKNYLGNGTGRGHSILTIQEREERLRLEHMNALLDARRFWANDFALMSPYQRRVLGLSMPMPGTKRHENSSGAAVSASSHIPPSSQPESENKNASEMSSGICTNNNNYQHLTQQQFPQKEVRRPLQTGVNEGTGQEESDDDEEKRLIIVESPVSPSPPVTPNPNCKLILKDKRNENYKRKSEESSQNHCCSGEGGDELNYVPHTPPGTPPAAQPQDFKLQKAQIMENLSASTAVKSMYEDSIRTRLQIPPFSSITSSMFSASTHLKEVKQEVPTPPPTAGTPDIFMNFIQDSSLYNPPLLRAHAMADYMGRLVSRNVSQEDQGNIRLGTMQAHGDIFPNQSFQMTSPLPLLLGNTIYHVPPKDLHCCYCTDGSCLGTGNDVYPSGLPVGYGTVTPINSKPAAPSPSRNQPGKRTRRVYSDSFDSMTLHYEAVDSPREPNNQQPNMNEHSNQQQYRSPPAINSNIMPMKITIPSTGTGSNAIGKNTNTSSERNAHHTSTFNEESKSKLAPPPPPLLSPIPDGQVSKRIKYGGNTLQLSPYITAEDAERRVQQIGFAAAQREIDNFAALITAARNARIEQSTAPPTEKSSVPPENSKKGKRQVKLKKDTANPSGVPGEKLYMDNVDERMRSQNDVGHNRQGPHPIYHPQIVSYAPHSVASRNGEIYPGLVGRKEEAKRRANTAGKRK